MGDSIPAVAAMAAAHYAGSPLFARPAAASRAARPPRRQLSPEEAGEIDYAFDRLSDGQDGLVTVRQLKIALRAMGFPVRKPDVRSLLRDAGLPDVAPLDRAAFSEVCAAKLLERPPAEEVARAFQLFDVGGRGRVGRGELRAVAAQLRVDVTPDEIADMVAEFDANGDGEIDAAEFAAMLASLDE